MFKALKACTIAVSLLMATAPAWADGAQGTITRGILKIGSDLTYPPYDYFTAANNPAGFDVELMTDVAKVANLKPEFVDTRFANLIIGLKSSQFDVIASTLYVNPDRAKQIDFIPYMKTGVSIAVSTASGLSFKKPGDLCGHRVGSIQGAAWIAKLSALSQTVCKGHPIDVREFPSSPEATQAVLSGGVDAQMEDSAVLQDAVSKLGGALKISSTGNLYPVVVGLGIRKGNDALIKTIQTALDKLERDGVYGALLKRYNVSKPTESEFKAALGG